MNEPEPDVGEPAGSARVDVAVVSWNTRELLARCLDSLAQDARSGLVSVWVVDNASSDGSAQMARERFPWAHVVDAGTNLGFGRAVNHVARRTRAPWIAAANADVATEPGALERLLDSGARHPGAGAIAPRLLLPDGTTQHSVHRFPSLPLLLAFHSAAARVWGTGDRLLMEGHWDADRPREIDWAHAAFLLVRREAWNAVGGFDEGHWMYAEDLDLCWRLRRAGWHVRYEPDAAVRHEVSAATTVAFGAERDRRSVAASYRWLARRRGMGYARAYALANLLPYLARWVVFAALAALGPRRFATARDRARHHLGAHALGLRSRASLLASG